MSSFLFVSTKCAIHGFLIFTPRVSLKIFPHCELAANDCLLTGFESASALVGKRMMYAVMLQFVAFCWCIWDGRWMVLACCLSFLELCLGMDAWFIATPLSMTWTMWEIHSGVVRLRVRLARRSVSIRMGAQNVIFQMSLNRLFCMCRVRNVQCVTPVDVAPWGLTWYRVLIIIF